MAPMYSLGTLLAVVIPISAVLLLSVLLLLIFGYYLRRQKSHIQKLNRQTSLNAQDERYNLRKKNPVISKGLMKSKLQVPWYQSILFCGGCNANAAHNELTYTSDENFLQSTNAIPRKNDVSRHNTQKNGSKPSKKYEGRHEMEFLSGQEKDLKRSSKTATSKAPTQIDDKNMKITEYPIHNSAIGAIKQHQQHHQPSKISGDTKSKLDPKSSEFKVTGYVRPQSQYSTPNNQHYRSNSFPKDILAPAPLKLNSKGIIFSDTGIKLETNDKKQYEKYHMDPLDDATSERERKAREVLNRDTIGRNAITRQDSIHSRPTYKSGVTLSDPAPVSDEYHGMASPGQQPQLYSGYHHETTNSSSCGVNFGSEVNKRNSTQYKWLEPPINLARVHRGENKLSMVASVVEPLTPISPLDETVNDVLHQDYDKKIHLQGQHEAYGNPRDSEDYSASHSFSSSNILYLKNSNIYGTDPQASRSQFSPTQGSYVEDDDSSGMDIYSGGIIPNDQTSPYARSTTPASRKSYPAASTPIPVKPGQNLKSPVEIHTRSNTISGFISRADIAKQTGKMKTKGSGSQGGVYSPEISSGGYRPIEPAPQQNISGTKERPLSLKSDLAPKRMPSASDTHHKVSQAVPGPSRTAETQREESVKDDDTTSYGTKWHLNRPNAETASSAGTEITHGTYATAPSRGGQDLPKEPQPKVPLSGNKTEHTLQSSIWRARRSQSTSSRASSLLFSISDQADFSTGSHRKKGSVSSGRSKQKLNKPLPMTPAGTKKDGVGLDDPSTPDTFEINSPKPVKVTGRIPASPAPSSAPPSAPPSTRMSAPVSIPISAPEEQIDLPKTDDGVVANLGGMLFHAVFPYHPALEDELPLAPREVVKVYQVFDDGWCFARKENPTRGRTHGICPKVCLANISRWNRNV